MKRGEIWWVVFDPAQGGEIRKRRPAVIVSNDKANAAQNRVQVLPATSAVATIYPWEAPIRINGRVSKVSSTNKCSEFTLDDPSSRPQ